MRFKLFLLMMEAMSVLLSAGMAPMRALSELELSGSTTPHRKLAFLFLMHGCFMLEPVWQSWFSEADSDAYIIVVHQDGVHPYEAPPVPFSGPGVPQQNVRHLEWRATPRFSEALATVSLDMLEQAYKDPDVRCFMIVSATTIPLRSFAELHRDYIDAQTGRCRYSTASVKTELNCGFIVSKSSQWLLLPRQQVEVLITTSREDVHTALQSIASYQALAEAHGFAWLNTTCSFDMPGAADEFLIPTLLSTHYAGLHNSASISSPTEGFIWNDYTHLARYWSSQGPELALQPYALPPADHTHPFSFDAATLLQSDLGQLYAAIGRDFLRKVVFTGLEVREALCLLCLRVTGTVTHHLRVSVGMSAQQFLTFSLACCRSTQESWSENSAANYKRRCFAR
jgi:hypothetical protein